MLDCFYLAYLLVVYNHNALISCSFAPFFPLPDLHRLWSLRVYYHIVIHFENLKIWDYTSSIISKCAFPNIKSVPMRRDTGKG